MDASGDLARRFMVAFSNLLIEEAVRICDPDVEITTLLDRPGEPKLRGHEGLREWFARMDSIWAFIDVKDWRIEHHGEWVLLSGTTRLRGKVSPNELTVEWAGVGRILGDRLDRIGIHLTRGEALAAIARNE
jgi:hypothetical protein